MIRDTLREFELSSNEAKTQISELPIPINEVWVYDLRLFTFRTGRPNLFQRDIAVYFDKVFSLRNQTPDDHILNYAVARLGSLTFDSGSWETLQKYLFQCLMVETGTFLSVLPMLQKQWVLGQSIDLLTLGNILNFQIVECCPMYYASEVSWALWAAIYWNIQIEERAAQALSKMSDPIVAVIALDAFQRGLIPKGLDTNLWQSFMETDALYGKNWLLAYEANQQGWLPSVGKKDHVTADTNFGFMKSHNVSFYDPSKARSVKFTSVAPSKTFAPLFSFQVS